MKACREAVLSKMVARRGISSGPAMGRTPSLREGSFQPCQLVTLFFWQREAPQPPQKCGEAVALPRVTALALWGSSVPCWWELGQAIRFMFICLFILILFVAIMFIFALFVSILVMCPWTSICVYTYICVCIYIYNVVCTHEVYTQMGTYINLRFVTHILHNILYFTLTHNTLCIYMYWLYMWYRHVYTHTYVILVITVIIYYTCLVLLSIKWYLFFIKKIYVLYIQAYIDIWK